MSEMSRRELIAALGGTVLAWPLTALAQQAGKAPTTRHFGPAPPPGASPRTPAFVQRLRELGWTDGRNVAIEYRWAEGNSERAAEFAAEFVRRKVDVIVTAGLPKSRPPSRRHP